MSFGAEEELVSRVHGRSREDRRRGIQLEGILDAVPTLEESSTNGDDDRLSPWPSAQGHDGFCETSTSGQPPPKHYLGDEEQCENTGVPGEHEDQHRESWSSPETQKRRRVC